MHSSRFNLRLQSLDHSLEQINIILAGKQTVFSGSGDHPGKNTIQKCVEKELKSSPISETQNRNMLQEHVVFLF